MLFDNSIYLDKPNGVSLDIPMCLIFPLFINFSKDGIPVKVLKVNNVGRHKIVDVESDGGLIKILSNTQDETPNESAFVTFNQKYTYVYGDDWIIE